MASVLFESRRMSLFTDALEPLLGEPIVVFPLTSREHHPHFTFPPISPWITLLNKIESVEAFLQKLQKQKSVQNFVWLNAGGSTTARRPARAFNQYESLFTNLTTKTCPLMMNWTAKEIIKFAPKLNTAVCLAWWQFNNFPPAKMNHKQKC